MKKPGVAAITAAFAALIVAAAPAAPARSGAKCPPFNGPGWTLVDPMSQPVNKAGTSWKLQTGGGVTCSFALQWAKKLVKTPFKGEALTKFKSVPKGWTCIAGGGLTGGGKGTPGQCNKGKKTFFWAPNYP